MTNTAVQVSSYDDVINGRDVIVAGLNALVDAGVEAGDVLVRDSHFSKYARELAISGGVIRPGTSCPLTMKVWTRELKAQCWTVEFDGVKYWVH